jgi:hypothetical protein
VTNSFSDRDRIALERAAEIQDLTGADAVRGWAGAKSYDVASTLSAFIEAFGAAQALLGDLSAIVNRLADTDDDTDDDASCAVCGNPIGIFQGRTGWHHYKGFGTAEHPVEIYDPGHEATPGGMLP